jgi:predicted enzyme related to lactoylglutathione lyase
MGLSLRKVVVDTTDVPRLAEFYRALLGWDYTDEPDVTWRVLLGPRGERLGFQYADALAATTWPNPAVPQQLHLDFTVATTEEMEEQHRRALELGAVLLQDRIDDPEEPLRVYTDPAGHTFCIFTESDE